MMLIKSNDTIYNSNQSNTNINIFEYTIHLNTILRLLFKLNYLWFWFEEWVYKNYLKLRSYLDDFYNYFFNDKFY